MRPAALALLWLAILVEFTACDALRGSREPLATAGIPARPTLASATPTLALIATPAPSATPTPVNPDSGWLTLRPGLEQRVLNLAGADGEWLENITILRLDPAYFHFDVAYRPGEPLALLRWQQETGAMLVVNGGFFTESNLATGLLISGGQRYGVTYEDFGGMFAVSQDGPSLRWLAQQPYHPDEPLLAALQSFPMLLTPGAIPGPTSDDGNRARRTVVAIDTDGRVLFLVAARGHFTLFQLSRFLQSSDLQLDTALNLDGGASSGLLLPESSLFIPALTLLPSAIVVYER